MRRFCPNHSPFVLTSHRQVVVRTYRQTYSLLRRLELNDHPLLELSFLIGIFNMRYRLFILSFISADAVQAALSQARTLFPFPLLGIDTDSGSEFLNEQVIVYCEQQYLTFTHGRSGVKNDQAHVEQKN